MTNKQSIIYDDPELWVKAVEEALTIYVAAKEAYEKAEIEFKTQKGELPQITGPFADLMAYADYVRRRIDAQTEADRIKTHVDVTRSAYAIAKRVVLDLLPSEVWFKINGKAVGISFSDWGGSNYGIEIDEWSDNLSNKSLDRRHRGD